MAESATYSYQKSLRTVECTVNNFTWGAGIWWPENSQTGFGFTIRTVASDGTNAWAMNNYSFSFFGTTKKVSDSFWAYNCGDYSPYFQFISIYASNVKGCGINETCNY